MEVVALLKSSASIGVDEINSSVAKATEDSPLVSAIVTLFSAIDSFDVDTVKKLLKSDLEFECGNRIECSVLHLAVGRIDVEPTSLEIDPVEEESSKSLNPLHKPEAFQRIIEVLLESGRYNVDTLGDSCQTALHHAIECCNCKLFASHEFHDYKDLANAIIKILLKNNANINAKTSYGETPLMKASDRGCSHIVELLLEWRDEFGVGVDLNARDVYGETALIKAAKSAHADVVELLLKHECLDQFQNIVGCYALHEAIHGAAGVFDDLSNDFHQSIGLDASENTVKVLDRYGANVSLGQTISSNLHKNNDIQKILGMLVTFGRTDLNSTDFVGNTVLDFAVKSKLRISQETVDMLRKFMNKDPECPENRPTIQTADKLGKTPLHRLSAALPEIRELGQIELQVQDSGKLLNTSPFKELFETMAVKKDNRGRTALHYAVMIECSCSHDAVLLTHILKLAHILNDTDKYGRTPLHYCEGECVYESLVKLGADEHVEDIDGKTPLDLKQLRETERKTFELSLKTIKVLRQIDGDEYHDIESNDDESKDHKYNDDESKDHKYNDDESKDHKYNDDESKDHKYNDDEHTNDEYNDDKYNDDESKDSECSNKDEAYNERTDDKRKLEEQSNSKKVDAWMIWKDSNYAHRDKLSKVIRYRVQQFMNRLSDEIRKKDPRFECRPVLVGSAAEGTRTGLPDEFDFSFVLTKLSDVCEVVPSPEAPCGFFRLKQRSCTAEYQPTSQGFQSQEGFDRLFNSNGFLSTTEIAIRFRILTDQVMSEPEFWNDENVLEWDTCNEVGLVYLKDELDEVPREVGPTIHPFTTIQLKLNRPIEGRYMFTSISIDIGSSIQLSDWWPEEALPGVSDEIKQQGYYLVFDQPQRQYPWVPYSDPYARISFAPAESRIIRKCSAVARAAYMVGKQLLSYYYKSHLTYGLKTCLLYCIEALKYNTRNVLLYEDIDPSELRFFVEKLMLCFHEFYLQDFIPCYLMPSFHIPIDKYLKSNHDQLISDPDFQYPVFAYRMYSIVSAPESLMDFCPPTPDPLNEKFDREELMSKLSMGMSYKIVIYRRVQLESPATEQMVWSDSESGSQVCLSENRKRRNQMNSDETKVKKQNYAETK